MRSPGRGPGQIAQRRHPDALAGLQPGRSLDPSTIDPDLSGAAQLFQPAVAEAGKTAAKPAVEPEPGLVLGNGNGLDTAHVVNPRTAASPPMRAATDSTTEATL